MIKKCPTCGLLSDPTAERCDCGYDFTTNTPPTAKPRPRARVDLMTGVVIFVIAYLVQLVDIEVRSLILPLLSLVLYGISLIYLLRALMKWISGRGNRAS